MKKVFVPIAQPIKGACQDVTKSVKETSKKNDKVLTNSNDKTLDVLKDTGILAFFLLSLLSKISNLEPNSQNELVKDRTQTESMSF